MSRPLLFQWLSSHARSALLPDARLISSPRPWTARRQYNAWRRILATVSPSVTAPDALPRRPRPRSPSPPVCRRTDGGPLRHRAVRPLENTRTPESC